MQVEEWCFHQGVADVDMDEVLYSKKARFKVLDTDPDYSVGKYKAVKLTLEEVGNRGDSSDLDGCPRAPEISDMMAYRVKSEDLHHT